MIDMVKLGADIVVALDKIDALEQALDPLLSLAPDDITAKIADAMSALRLVLSGIHGQATVGGVRAGEAAADAAEAVKFPVPEGAVIKSEPPKE